MEKKNKTRVKPVPESKKNLVREIAEKMKNSKTILVSSIRGLPASQFQKIKSGLRGKAEIVVAKKSIVIRAIASTEKGTLQNLKNFIGSDVALFFSNLDAFELSSLLVERQSASKAKAGDIAPEDINVEAGPTELLPGPAISELSSLGLKVAVEEGKLAIKKGTTIVKKGDKISENVASVMGKLRILPMKVGFSPMVAYDANNDKIYEDIKIDKKATLEELRDSFSRALGFAIKIGFISKETISYFIGKAAMEEMAIEKLINKSGETK